MDTAINQTFTNSSISVKNVLSGGATYILALSDSTGSYAASSDLIFSGGGGDNSCLVTTPSTSSRPTKTATADKEGSSSKSPAVIGSIVAVCAVILIAAAVAFLMYRKKKRAQHQSLLAGRLSGAGSGGGGSGGSDSSTYKGSGNGREKFMSPMGGGPAAGGGMWRPESPTEYPGITSAPVRFRVTNPDDDARSERSFRMGGIRGGRGGDAGLRASEDTVRSGSTGLPWSTQSESQFANERSQRQSLIESDANALYPPSSYRGPPGSPRSRFGAAAQAGGSTTGSSGLYEEADQPWPTYSSAASSETEDHYTDLPASSADILAMHRRRMDSISSNTTGGGSEGNNLRVIGGNRGPLSSDEMDVEEMYRDEVYSRDLHSDEMSIDPAWDSLTRPGMNPSPSQAYGSPFADSQRVKS